MGAAGADGVGSMSALYGIGGRVRWPEKCSSRSGKGIQGGMRGWGGFLFPPPLGVITNTFQTNSLMVTDYRTGSTMSTNITLQAIAFLCCTRCNGRSHVGILAAFSVFFVRCRGIELSFRLRYLSKLSSSGQQKASDFQNVANVHQLRVSGIACVFAMIPSLFSVTYFLCTKLHIFLDRTQFS